MELLFWSWAFFQAPSFLAVLEPIQGTAGAGLNSSVFTKAEFSRQEDLTRIL